MERGREGGRSVFGAHHSFAVFTDGCTNKSVLNKIVCESFSEKRVSAQKVGQHLIITDHAITEEGGRKGRGERSETRTSNVTQCNSV